MSILVKGIDMPKACADCPCFYDNLCCNALPYGEGAFSDHKGFDEYEGRLPNCPLEEATEEVEHGRWLDLDAAPGGLFYATCSVCGERQVIEVANYCPMCGANLSKEEEA